MAKTIGVISIKGGVGKTTISSAIASDLANSYGKKVLLVDANYSAPNLGLHMDIVSSDNTIHDVLSGKIGIEKAIHKRFGVDVIPGSHIFEKEINMLKLKDKLEKIKDKYDFIILDSSPSLNDEILSTMIASDRLFVVTTADYPTLICSLKAAKLAKQRGKPISGIIINKIRDPAFEVSLNEIEEAVGIPVVARIKDDKMSTRALYNRVPIPVFDRKSKMSKEISRLNAALTYNQESRSWIRGLFKSNLGKEEVNRGLLKENFYTSFFSEDK